MTDVQNLLLAEPNRFFDNFDGAYADSNISAIRDFVNALPIPVYGKNRDGTYFLANDAFANLLGRPGKEIIGKTSFELSPSELAQVYTEADNELFESGGFTTHKSEIVDAAGRSHTVLVHKGAFDVDHDGALEIVGILIGREVVTQALDAATLAARDLGERIKEITCLYDVSEILDDIDGDFDRTLQAVADRLPAGWLRPEATCAEIEVEGRCFQTRNFQNGSEPLSHRIRVNGQARGWIRVWCSEAPDDEFSPRFLPEELALLRQIAFRIGHAIEETEGEMALRKQQAEFQHTFEQAAVGICHVSPNGSFLRINNRLCEIWGYPRDEIIKLTFQEITHPDDLDRDLEQVEQVLRGDIETYSMEKRYYRKDGSMLWGNLTVSLVRKESGDPEYFISVVEDITKRRDAEERVRALTAKIRKTFIETVAALTEAMEHRDPYTAGHQKHVADLATAIAQRLDLAEDDIEGLRIGATIHDIGKLYVPAELLSKPGKLSAEEFALIKTHSAIGHSIIDTIEMPWPVGDMVRQHHERLDGSGYPDGLKGDAISMAAKIIAVADTVEAICGHRPYRPARGKAEAIEALREGRAILFDARVVDACLSILKTENFAWIGE